MERVDYPKIVQEILGHHTSNDLETQTEVQLLFDPKRHRYQLLIGHSGPSQTPKECHWLGRNFKKR